MIIIKKELVKNLIPPKYLSNFNSLTYKNKRFFSVYKQSSESRINAFLKSKNLVGPACPVFIYDNLDNDKVKKQIAQETKGLSGVYLILNKETSLFMLDLLQQINLILDSQIIYFILMVAKSLKIL